MSRPSSPHDPPAPASPPASVAALDEQAINACCRRFERSFRSEPYYSSGRTWSDYEPAYRYALQGYRAHDGQAFSDIEEDLAREWELVREASRLTWAEARPAMAAAWELARGCGCGSPGTRGADASGV